jgi:rieske iron-sulfur protein
MCERGGRGRPETSICEEGVDRQFQCRTRGIGRRAALGMGVGFTLAPHLALGQAEPARERPREGDLLVAVGATGTPVPLKPDDLALGSKQIFVWPIDPESNTVRDGSRLNKILLLRLDAESLDPLTKERAAEGAVAYSAICTHTGCDVIGWHADSQCLECPCHYSQYDPKAAAKVVSGPAPRPLPALPLRIADGRLVVAKPFTGRAGFQQM